MFLYVLELRNKKFYVGISKNPEQRLQDHRKGKGKGSEWTRLHPPIRLYSQRPIDSSDESKQSVEENTETIKFMKQHGIDYVRGGIWTKATLSSSDLEMVRKMMGSTDNLCYHCLNKGHYAAECPTNKSEQQKQQQGSKKSKTSNNPSLTKKTKTTSTTTTMTTVTTNNKENNDNNGKACNRCGRKGHLIGKCYASKDSKGCIIIDDDKKDKSVTKKRKTTPTTTTMTTATTKNKENNDNNEKECNRCGRKGHLSVDCFASKHSNGCTIIDDDDEQDEYLFEIAAGHPQVENTAGNPNSSMQCFRCGRTGHFVSDCYATKHSKGYLIDR